MRTVPGDLKYQPGALTIYMGKPEIPVWKLNGFPSLQSVLQAFPAPVRWESWDESVFCSSSNFRAISGSEALATQASAIPFYDLRRCNFSTIFSLFSWSGYTLWRVVLPPLQMFIVLCLRKRFPPGWDMCANDNHPTWFPLPSTLFSACNLKYLFESLV